LRKRPSLVQIQRLGNYAANMMCTRRGAVATGEKGGAGVIVGSDQRRKVRLGAMRKERLFEANMAHTQKFRNGLAFCR
jgi:hypothetical protein